MADAIDTQTTDAAGPADAVDTLKDEDSLMAEFEDTDISFDDEPETATEEPTTDEAATETEEGTEEESDDNVEEAEPESKETDEAESNTDAEVEDTTTPDVEAERKAHNDEMAKARIEARKAREEAEAIKQQAQEENIRRYLQEAEDDAELLKQRELDVREFRLTEQAIKLNTTRLQTDIDRAVNEIDLFKTGTPAVQKRLYAALDQFEAMHVVKDEQGRFVDVKGDVFKHLQDEADSIRELLGDGAKQQLKQKTDQKRRTIATPVKTPVKPKSDPDLDAFDEVANGY